MPARRTVGSLFRCCMLPLADYSPNASSNGRVMRAWEPWLVSTLSLPRMSCCNLLMCSTARQLFAKRYAGPSLLLSTLSAMLRVPVPPARRWRPQLSPVLGKCDCFCLACSCSDQHNHPGFAAFFQGDWGSLLHAALDEAGAVGLQPSDDTTAEPKRTEAEPETITGTGEEPGYPHAPVALDRAALLTNLRRARKRSAPGPSAFAGDMLRLILDDEEATLAFGDVATLFRSSQQSTWDDWLPFASPLGAPMGARGLVVGDLLRRLVARTLAQQFSKQLDAACHQYALSTRTGAEALLQGSQPAVDTTLVSPLTSAGAPRRAAGRTAGAALALARKAKERTYPELRQSARCKLVVLALELGGRWSTEAATFVKLLARLRAMAVPASSRGPSISAFASFASRWSAVLSFAAARAFAASLLSLPLGGTANVDGESPLLSDILADSSLEPPLASRMP
ncbi:unnamed protein product [Symbiodinium sp. CCMP2592]|nr:unnamed protein product [Symbiodinium sp. CCMP2592]